jgi:hypothetical protein
MKVPDTNNITKTMKGKKEIAAKQGQLKGKTRKNQGYRCRTTTNNTETTT